MLRKEIIPHAFFLSQYWRVTHFYGLTFRLLLFIAFLLLPTSLSAEDRVSSQDDVTVTVYGERHQSVAERLRIKTPQYIKEIQEQIGIGYNGKVSLVLCTTREAFRRYYTRYSSQSSGNVLGVAYAADQSIALNLAMIGELGIRPEVVYQHELCHLVLGKHIEPRLRPLWFEEGVAQYVSETPYEALGKALGWSRGLAEEPDSFAEISAMARTPQEMADGYGHAVAALRDLVKNYGEEGLQRFIANLSRAQAASSFAQTYQKTFKVSLQSWEKEFLSGRKRSALGRIFSFLGSYIFSFAMLIAVVALFFVVAKKKQQQKELLERWREEDELFPPDPSWASAEEPEHDIDQIVQDSLEQKWDKG